MVKITPTRPILFALIGLIGLGFIFTLIYLLANGFFKIYQTQSETHSTPRQIETEQQAFAIKKITVKSKTSDCYLEILRNGTVNRICGNTLQTRELLSTEKILTFFNNLDEESFLNLVSDYFSDTLDLTITIETNRGTKTVTVSSSGGTSLPPAINHLIDDLDDIEDELDDPPTSPPPTLPPTIPPTPSPPNFPTPTPTATSTGPTPTPIPYNRADPQDSFDCTSISQTDVTVSNTRCLPE